MSADYVELMTDMTRSAYETAHQWAEINTDTLNTLTQQQLDMFGFGIERGFGMARKAMQVKDYKDVIAVQTEMAQEMAAMAAEETRKTMQVLRVSRKAVTGLLQTRAERVQ